MHADHLLHSSLYCIWHNQLYSNIARAATIQFSCIIPFHRSRSHLLNEHRASKPETSTSQRHKELPKIARATAQVNSDDEENVDDLEEDDFANLDDSDFDDGDDDSLDDELSAMSGAEGEEVDFSSGDEDDNDLDDDEDLSDGEEDHSQDDLESGSSRTLSDNENEDLEDRYATLLKKKNKREEEEAKKRHSKLPTFGAQEEDEDEEDENAEASEADSDQEDEEAQTLPNRKSRVAHAPVEVSDESDEDEEEKSAKARAAQPKPNPLGARFGRPAVSSLLEIEDRTERFQAAREELAVLGREIMAEPELGVSPCALIHLD